MGSTLTIVVLVGLAAALIGALAFATSRPNGLRAHRPAAEALTPGSDTVVAKTGSR